MIVQRVDALDFSALEKGRRHHLKLDLIAAASGERITAPVIVVRGAEDGPTLGVTAAIHGNELNGIPVIHRMVAELDPAALRGTLAAVPVVNLPGFERYTREFNDGDDLNRIMPGKANGTSAQRYAHAFLERAVRRFDFLVDLHTASFGRINSLYVRADLLHPVTAGLARVQNPQILVHNCGADGTLRGAAVKLGVPAITVEVGNPQRLQRPMIEQGLAGLKNTLIHLGMVDGALRPPEREPVMCARSYWIYTDAGGILEVPPALVARVEEGAVIGRVTSLYGMLEREYHAPEAGVVVGKSTNPANQEGSRILHLGIPGSEADFKECPLP